MYVRYADILILMSHRTTVLAVPRTIYAHVAGRSLGMMTQQPHIPIYAESGFLKGCNGGVSISQNPRIGILLGN